MLLCVTGLAHLLEHMAFKGTRRVGAKDWKQEAPLLDAMDEGESLLPLPLYCVFKTQPTNLLPRSLETKDTNECCRCIANNIARDPV